jgi:anti-sigma B factor antagonist
MTRPGLLTITRETGPADLRLCLHGELDLACVEEFKELLDSAECRERATVTVDLAALEFMDSTGLCALIHASKNARLDGRKLRIVNPCSTVKRVFEVTGLTSLLDQGVAVRTGSSTAVA